MWESLRRSNLPLVRSARASALVASSVVALAGALAGAVRVLPWLLDPDVPWHVAAPFARGLAAVALESALLVGWPVGWAVACFRCVESGEARVLQTLGESPATTVKRLLPQGVALGVALAATSLVCGADASAPGRVATELVARARAPCARVSAPSTYVIPFTGMTWLCAPGRQARVAGAVPGVVGGAAVTATDARISGDFRSVELDDARLALPGDPPTAVRVGMLSLRGMAPWAHASTLPAALRALLLAVAALSTACAAAYAVLRRAPRARGGAIALGAVGPLVALGVLRSLERSGAAPAAFLLVPVAASAFAGAAGAIMPRARALARLALARRKMRC